MTREEIATDIKLVTEALGVSILILNGALKPQPTDLATMQNARDAFNRLRGVLEPASGIVSAVERETGIWQCRDHPDHPLLTSLAEPRCSICHGRCEPY